MAKKHPPSAPDNAVRPFLKWAGNKYRVLHEVKNHLPQGERLIEPFVGSGAVFLNTDYPSYLLCDANPDLIDVYNYLKRKGKNFIADCRALFDDRHNTKEHYYRLREEFNTSSDRYHRAVLFVYLNRHGYNGLCRYNQKGGFNVPFGRYKKPYFPEKEMLAFHGKAKHAKFKTLDFTKSFSKAKQGDVIYCDPPYAPLNQPSNFTSYSSGGFNLQQQKELADLAIASSSEGVPVLISNHSTPFTKRIYTGAKTREFAVQRFISCQGHRRIKAKEILALFE
jgi:DNA adenine methylase